MSTSTTSVATTRTAPGCIDHAALFQDPMLEEPLPSGSTIADRHRQAALTGQAEKVCQGCPLVADCLYRAVVDHDVAGYAGGTTAVQRRLIRRRLGVVVAPEDFDTLAGVTGRNRQVDHDEVVRLRNANPHESLETLAHRLGCSLSTVKRHLRRERAHPSIHSVGPAKPTLTQVLTTTIEIKHGVRAPSQAA